MKEETKEMDKGKPPLCKGRCLPEGADGGINRNEYSHTQYWRQYLLQAIPHKQKKSTPKGVPPGLSDEGFD